MFPSDLYNCANQFSHKQANDFRFIDPNKKFSLVIKKIDVIMIKLNHLFRVHDDDTDCDKHSLLGDGLIGPFKLDQIDWIASQLSCEL